MKSSIIMGNKIYSNTQFNALFGEKLDTACMFL